MNYGGGRKGEEPKARVDVGVSDDRWKGSTISHQRSQPVM